MLIDPKLTTPEYIRKLIVKLHTRSSLILIPELRDILIDLLRLDEAQQLALVMGLKGKDDPYEALKGLRIRRGTEREHAIADFFELPLPPLPETVDTSSETKIAAQYPLFPHQQLAANNVKQKLLEPPRRVLLHMPTGSGKTRTAMNVICDHLRSFDQTVVVWLAYSEELCEQAAVEFEKAWNCLGNRELSIYRFWGQRSLNLDEVHDGIVVAGLSKLYRIVTQDAYSIGVLGGRSSLVIIDEAHISIAETYRLLIDVLVVHNPTATLLGLTATPGRTWADIQVDKELSDFFARQKVTLQIEGYQNPVDYLVDQEYLARTEYRSLFYESGLELSDKDVRYIRDTLEVPEKILDNLAEDEQRNLRIIVEVESLAQRHRRIILFATTVSHADLIATVLQARGLSAYSITSNTTSLDRARIIEDYKRDSSDTKIICNYGVLTTGFDAPRTSAALIARPTKSLVLYSQMVGRAIRGVKAGGNQTAEIVTVVDLDLPGFSSVAESFKNWEDIWE